MIIFIIATFENTKLRGGVKW